MMRKQLFVNGFKIGNNIGECLWFYSWRNLFFVVNKDRGRMSSEDEFVCACNKCTEVYLLVSPLHLQQIAAIMLFQMRSIYLRLYHWPADPIRPIISIILTLCSVERL